MRSHDQDSLRHEVEVHLRLRRWLGLRSIRLGDLPSLPAPEPKPLSPSAIQLGEIESQARECTRCALAESRTNVVFGVGSSTARLALVGEAPGFHEDQKGEPFVGRAGGLLTRMLAKIDLSREEVYITNVLKCRPPQNRDPSPEEKRCCTPFLETQLDLIAPEAILALGGHAAKSLLGLPDETPVGRLRGKVHTWRGIALVVTYHPAYLLRRPQERWKAMDDLMRVRGVLDQGGMR